VPNETVVPVRRRQKSKTALSFFLSFFFLVSRIAIGSSMVHLISMVGGRCRCNSRVSWFLVFMVRLLNYERAAARVSSEESSQS
jgi:hypothetical protein